MPNDSESKFAQLPPAIINHFTVMKEIKENPGCGMRHFLHTFVKGKVGGTLADVKGVRNQLQQQGLIKVVSYRHELTEAGEQAHAAAQG